MREDLRRAFADNIALFSDLGEVDLTIVSIQK